MGLSWSFGECLRIPAGASFDDFNDLPFVRAEEGDEIIVSFTRTNDMYFFDQIFRCGGRPSAIGLLDELLV